MQHCTEKAGGLDGALKQLHSRIHGHGGEFSVEVSVGSRRRVTGERLRRRHLVSPAELQRGAAVHLLDLGQVRLGSDHHARSLAVHEVLLPSEGRTEGRSVRGRTVREAVREAVRERCAATLP